MRGKIHQYRVIRDPDVERENGGCGVLATVVDGTGKRSATTAAYKYRRRCDNNGVPMPDQRPAVSDLFRIRCAANTIREENLRRDREKNDDRQRPRAVSRELSTPQTHPRSPPHHLVSSYRGPNGAKDWGHGGHLYFTKQRSGSKANLEGPEWAKAAGRWSPDANHRNFCVGGNQKAGQSGDEKSASRVCIEGNELR